MVFESTSSSIHDAASSARERLQSNLGYTFKDGVESLLKAMFAPCAGVATTATAGCESSERPAAKTAFHIGGVPKSEMGGPSSVWNPPAASANISPSRVLVGGTGPREPSFPFEIKARTRSDASRTETGHRAPTVTPTHLSSSFDAHRDFRDSPAADGPSAGPHRTKAEALTKLRQLGAQHQLASGVHGDSLADKARPVSPELPRLPAEPLGIAHDVVDFDDGISAISAHTLEEMERRGLIHPPPPPGKERIANATNPSRPRSAAVSRIDETNALDTFDHRDASHNPFRTSANSSVPQSRRTKALSPVELSRIASRATAATEDTDGELWMAEEARYWQTVAEDDERAKGTNGNANATQSRKGSRTTRRTGRPSVEERARKLRELSRSRSRSDGTGSVSVSRVGDGFALLCWSLSQSWLPFSNDLLTRVFAFFVVSAILRAVQSHKSSASLRSHPHDTVPVFASDVAHAKSKTSKSKGLSRRSFVPGSFEEGIFPVLDYGEI
ncbi:hypothetical protein ACHAXS_008501 [Conticribra weissflogii]